MTSNKSLLWTARLLVLILFVGGAVYQYEALVGTVSRKLVWKFSTTSSSVETTSTGNNSVVSHNGAMNNNATMSSLVRNDTITPGVVVLGMHRSGTSLLSGLLVKGLGCSVPRRQMPPQPANPLGYFENWNVMMQNNLWLEEQGMKWDRLNCIRTTRGSRNIVGGFDPSLACTKPSSCFVPKEEEEKYYFNAHMALKAYNDPNTVLPWLIKDPRLCITLKVWLKSLRGSPPAVLFTVREPLEVARSLQERDGLSLNRGMKLWIWYNRLAIENSKDMCRVTTSKDAVSRDPISELSRIGHELESKCGLPLDQQINTTAIAGFFRSDLLHHNSSRSQPSSAGKTKCLVPKLTELHPNATSREQASYWKARTIYCDLRNGKAFSENYAWPSLE